jgi:hypothetical protein
MCAFTTICHFGCDRWFCCHATCIVAISMKIVAKSNSCCNAIEEGCRKLSLLPRFISCCGEFFCRCNTKMMLQRFYTLVAFVYDSCYDVNSVAES